ncbi:MAG: response regulator [Planctomycetes bacterium]|nr:response regulator [Planctomycetota bacterium]
MKQANILVVDDDAAIRKIVSTNLTRAGYGAVVAPDAEQALAILSENGDFDLIISDVMMPRVDGMEFRKRVLSNERTAHIPFVMLTAKRGTDDRISSYELDVVAYLTKPFEAKELLAKVASILRQESRRVAYTSEQRLEAIRQLTVTLNHEINNPLSTVLGQAELLLRGDALPPPEKARKMVGEIREAGYRIREVIQKINRIRQIATKTYLSDIEMVDLDRAMSEKPEESAK